MEQYGWVLWLVLGVVLVIAETFTLGFVLLWFGVAALGAALMSFLGFGYFAQFAVFAFTSIILTALSKKIFAPYYRHGDEDLTLTGIDALPGKTGIVTSAPRNLLGEAEVKVFGSTWSAFADDENDKFAEGDRVEIIRVEGAKLFVRKVKKIPEWREE